MITYKVYEEHWIFKLWFMKKYTGMFLFGAILLRYPEVYYRHVLGEKYLKALIRHEQFHGVQAYLCGGYINFYALYLFWYIQGLIRYRSHDKAYANIWFEVAAREWTRG